MHFSKLRVAGFKSFVDRTELQIEDGMTGVIGPNGCGKSNVVEALRWVMGETSAKSMRGGEMDDVIFGGTTQRPQRNAAEVVLHIDNTVRDAPALYNDSEEIEVSRKIGRGSGSTYRINGKETRARDVQLLFADMATGAHSTAMVSQGRIGALIGAKPTERRSLLEEAAGIKGLHSRRHEAELRLRAAETNLERLEDVIGALEGQFQSLKRQVRQAARYRRLSEQIRRHESMFLHQRRETAAQALSAAREQLQIAEAAVATRTEAAAGAATAQATAAATLPDLRQREAEAAAELQRLLLARGELEREETRIADAQRENANRLAQIGGDIERETALATDANTAITRLGQEADSISSARSGEAEAEAQAKTTLNDANKAVELKDRALNDLSSERAAIEARHTALVRQRDQLHSRIDMLKRRATDMETERAKLASGIADDAELVAAERAIGDADATLEKTRAHAEAEEETLATAQNAENTARQTADQAQSELNTLLAEIKALSELVDPAEGDFFAPLIEDVAVDPGYEVALGIALGEDIDAPVDSTAPVFWNTLPPYETIAPLPDGVAPLSQFVRGAPALARGLSQIGVVQNSEHGAALQTALAPGQCLVGQDGALWRWDGYTVTAGAPSAAAIRLGQRNRLNALRETETRQAPKVALLASARDEARQARANAQDSVRAAQAAQQASFSQLNDARKKHATASNASNAARSRLAALVESSHQAATDLEEAEQQWTNANQAMEELDDPEAKARAIDVVRRELAELRAAQAERRSAFDQLRREIAGRAQRLSLIEAELQSWRGRAAGANERMTDLNARRTIEDTEKARLSGRPEEIAAQRTQLFEALERAEAKRNIAADALADGETQQTNADKALREAESAMAEAREDRVRREGLVEQAANEERVIVERIFERLNCAPDQILAEAEIDPDEAMPAFDIIEAKFERLSRERDNMGPVNLRAEAEAEELEQQIASMQTEREDLLAAIARLRQGIGTLNREGRQRLLEAFETVNSHFQELFTKLFGGGNAHLTLTEADDPLEAGLEIMASPPGKKMQIMSLLSGGEQALTAISLLFAVFMTNPAPICVLDEVDAPLDDANVDRFCSLLDEIARSGDTRFLVITHHRITMARMDRLYGVTMGEQGVSQLVSVDLHGAEALRESA
ncbi:MAG: chromosome segregation protein [Alphaproteobacteria bacterium]